MKIRQHSSEKPVDQKKKLKVDRKRYLETREIWKQDLPKIMKCRESCSKREF